jgi:transposase
MAKDKQKRNAFHLYTTQFMTAKAIAEIVTVNEKTIGNWIKTGNWKGVRDANFNSSLNQASNIKSFIGELTDQQLEINEKIKEAKAKGDNDLAIALRKESGLISQEVAIQNKALERIENNKISLSTYLTVMTDIFQQLEQFDKSIYNQTLDFQESHLQHISVKHG